MYINMHTCNHPSCNLTQSCGPLSHAPCRERVRKGIGEKLKDGEEEGGKDQREGRKGEKLGREGGVSKSRRLGYKCKV